MREAQPRLRTALTGIEHCYITLRTLCREIFDRTMYLPPELEAEAYRPEARAALADVLECAAEAMCGVAQVAAETGPAETARAACSERPRRAAAPARPAGPAAADRPAHRRGGLAAARRAAGHRRPAAGGDRGGGTSGVRPVASAVIAEGPRQAVRRVIDAAAEDALPLITERPRQAMRRAVDVAAEVASAAATEAAANLAISDPRVQRRRAADADRAVHVEQVPAEALSTTEAKAVSAAEAAAVAQVTAEMASEAAAIAAATAEAAEHAEGAPAAGAETGEATEAETRRPDGPRRPCGTGESSVVIAFVELVCR